MKLKQYLLTSFATLLLGASLAQAADLPTLRVGDQNYYNVRASMEASGVLEGAPYQVEWKHFQSAAPVAEGLQAGRWTWVSSATRASSSSPPRVRR